jgi:hypothetical protein
MNTSVSLWVRPRWASHARRWTSSRWSSRRPSHGWPSWRPSSHGWSSRKPTHWRTSRWPPSHWRTSRTHPHWRASGTHSHRRASWGSWICTPHWRASWWTARTSRHGTPDRASSGCMTHTMRLPPPLCIPRWHPLVAVLVAVSL